MIEDQNNKINPNPVDDTQELLDKQRICSGTAEQDHPLPSHLSQKEPWSLIDISLVLANNLRILIFTPLIFVITTIIYVLFIIPPVYTSTTTILPSSGSGEAFSNLRGIAAQFNISLPRREDTDITSAIVYPKIIKSRKIARTLLSRNFDTEEFGAQKSLLQIITYGDDKPEVGPDTLTKQGIELLTEEMIEVLEDPVTGFLTINVSSMEPQLSADLAQAVIEELDHFQRKLKLQRIIDKREFIQERISAVQQDLEKSENVLKQFRERNRQIVSSPALLLEQERFAREIEVQKSIFITLKEQLEMTKIQEVAEAPMVQILDAPEAPLYRSKPKRTQSVLIAAFLGIVFGIIIVLFKSYFGGTLESDKDKMNDLQVLLINNIRGLIPWPKINQTI